MRDSYFDNLKFLLVTLVVIGHAIIPLTSISISMNTLYVFIYFFHMPLFIFISGYFSKNINENYGEKIFTRVIIPYIFFEVLYQLFDHYLYLRKEFIFTFFSPSFGLWYLVSLATWKLVLPYVIKVKYALLISTVVSILMGYTIDLGTYFSLSRTFVFFPMFLAGYYFNRNHLDRFLSKSNHVVSIIVLITSFLLIYNYGQNINTTLLRGFSGYHAMKVDEWYAGLYRGLAFLVSIVISASILSIVPKRKIPFISDMGTRTIYPYLLHGFVVLYLDKIKFQQNSINTPYEKLIWLLCCVFFVMLLSSSFVRNIFKPIVEPKVDWIFISQKSKVK